MAQRFPSKPLLPGTSCNKNTLPHPLVFCDSQLPSFPSCDRMARTSPPGYTFIYSYTFILYIRRGETQPHLPSLA